MCSFIRTCKRAYVDKLFLIILTLGFAQVEYIEPIRGALVLSASEVLTNLKAKLKVVFERVKSFVSVFLLL